MSLARPVRMGIRSKYFAKATKVDGIRFDSTLEAKRYSQLKILQKLGQISNLERQPTFDLHSLNQQTGEIIRVGKYTADFRYKTGDTIIIEDTKSEPTKTTYYRLKKRMMKAEYNIDISEVKSSWLSPSPSPQPKSNTSNPNSPNDKSDSSNTPKT